VSILVKLTSILEATSVFFF